MLFFRGCYQERGGGVSPGILAGFAAALGFGLRPHKADGKALRNAGGLNKVCGPR